MGRRKVLIICIDAGGHDYLAASDIPNIRRLADAGFYIRASSVIPSVTNVNNVSIATGCFPAAHGITTNYHVDRETGEGTFIEDNRFLLVPTLFEHAKSAGFAEKTALLVTKQKLLRMLEGGADIRIAAEAHPRNMLNRLENRNQSIQPKLTGGYFGHCEKYCAMRIPMSRSVQQPIGRSISSRPRRRHLNATWQSSIGFLGELWMTIRIGKFTSPRITACPPKQKRLIRDVGSPNTE